MKLGNSMNTKSSARSEQFFSTLKRFLYVFVVCLGRTHLVKYDAMYLLASTRTYTFVRNVIDLFILSPDEPD